MKNMALKVARVRLDLSQEELANKVDVSRQTIGLIELGKYNPSLELCLRICYVLELSLDELFWRDQL